MNENDTTRRQFLRGVGGSLGAAWLAAHWPAIAAAAGHAQEHAATPAGDAGDDALRVLTTAQARDVEAIAAQIVPGGDTPGAREAGVVYFVDHVHAGAFKSQAGDFLADLESFRTAFALAHPGTGSFADLPPASQLEYLRSVENTRFFGAMRFLTVLGLLALPSYGGNRGKSGWKLVGFVDQHAWQPPFGHYDAGYQGFVPYAAEDRS
jgi:Gluconate 2-dehydrogenase subunit 3